MNSIELNPLVMHNPEPLRMQGCLTYVMVLALFCALPAGAQTKSAPAAAEPLKLLISVSTQTVVEPLPIRVTLHLHNFGTHALWLYRPVRDAAEAGGELSRSSGGSTLVTSLKPLGLSAGAVVNLAAIGTVMRPAGLPHPRLVEVDPGGDFEETLAVHVQPALLRGPSGSSGNLPFWGRYQLSVIYGAGYPNGGELRRDVKMAPWEGGVTSNTVEIDLAAPSAANTGVVSGSIVDDQSGFVGDALVSLSGDDGHLLDQMVTNGSGRFSFSHLPLGTYWTSVRLARATRAGGMYEHAILTASQPEAAMKLLLAREDISDAKKLLHKPVIFRVTDSAGRAVDGATLDVTWSNGPVMEDLKARTNTNGVAVMEVLAGSNYVSISKKGCKQQDVRSDVTEDIGVDGFNLTFDCERK